MELNITSRIIPVVAEWQNRLTFDIRSSEPLETCTTVNYILNKFDAILK